LVNKGVLCGSIGPLELQQLHAALKKASMCNFYDGFDTLESVKAVRPP
jgi:hypothetical protein